MKFDVKNSSSNNEDATFSEITLKENGSIDQEDDMANFTLNYEGTVISTVASINSKYVTFKFDPIIIKDGKTEKFVVKADITGWASDKISFTLDKDLDVTATASKYGFVSITNNITAVELTVQAGEVTIVSTDPTNTDIREDKDDVILGKIKVNAVAGNNIEIQAVKFVLEDESGSNKDVDDVFENANFELYDETNGIVYDLTGTAGTDTDDRNLENDDLNIQINGDITLVVRGDTETNITNFDNYKFKLTASASGDYYAGLKLVETGDDKVVSDVTPSSLTFKTISGTESSATVATIVLSDTNAVVSSQGIEMLQFQVSADESSALELTEAKVHFSEKKSADTAASTKDVNIDWTNTDLTLTAVKDGVAGDDIDFIFDAAADWVTAITVAVDDKEITVTGVSSASTVAEVIAAINADSSASALVTASLSSVGTGTDAADEDLASTALAGWVGADVTNTHVSTVYLMNGTTVLDKVSGSQLASGVATFDGFKEIIAKNGKVTYTVVADLVDNENNGTDRMAASLQSIDVEDEDGDDVVATGLPGMSARDLTINASGYVVIAVDNTDTETDKSKNVLGNTTSPFVASYELTATNEAIKIKDFKVTATEDTLGDFIAAVSEVIIYANDKTTEIAREPVTALVTTFSDVNYVLEEGNENVYLKVVTRKIGKDQAGIATGDDMELQLDIVDAEGNASGKTLTHGSNSNDFVSAASNSFETVSVKVSAIAFVSEANGTTVATSLNNGDNNVAIVSITTDSNTNTDNDDNSSLKTLLEQIKLTESKYANTTVNYYEIEKINGNDAAIKNIDEEVDNAEHLDFTPTVANSTEYTAIVNEGTARTYTSDASATASEIVSGLALAINSETNVAGTSQIKITVSGAFTDADDSANPASADVVVLWQTVAVDLAITDDTTLEIATALRDALHGDNELWCTAAAVAFTCTLIAGEDAWDTDLSPMTDAITTAAALDDAGADVDETTVTTALSDPLVIATAGANDQFVTYTSNLARASSSDSTQYSVDSKIHFNVNALATDDEIDNATTVYYVVKANVTKDATNDNDDYIKVGFAAFDGGEVKYKSDDATNNTSITEARLGITKLDGTQINE